MKVIYLGSFIQRFKTKFLLSPFELYRSLRSLNPSPFLFYFNLEESLKEQFSIKGSSPEILVKLKDVQLLADLLYMQKKRGKDLNEDLNLKGFIV